MLMVAFLILDNQRVLFALRILDSFCPGLAAVSIFPCARIDAGVVLEVLEVAVLFMPEVGLKRGRLVNMEGSLVSLCSQSSSQIR